VTVRVMISASSVPNMFALQGLANRTIFAFLNLQAKNTAAAA
jgi:hypothetical protein